MAILATSMAKAVDESRPWVKLSQLTISNLATLFLATPETPLIPSPNGLCSAA
ncbi:hypothetical protein K435DRAFT_783024 [Dendrothele bispora CBS 962.96]|uniref:Uncharacterized protein n=1 Tax=Dendrothele bispora (strain CBS 962.96) TaxID=1314807 RepID=A0A4S8LBB5_DENBC|nr:hypothetical protein K435DRAFT_783024 [Dendrothele bispora CBS 962.96]